MGSTPAQIEGAQGAPFDFTASVLLELAGFLA